MNKSKTNAELLGGYLFSLDVSLRPFCGARVKAIMAFLDSGADFSKKGWLRFRKDCPGFLSDTAKGYVADFLYFHGVRLGQRRKAKEPKIVERLDEISAANQRKVAEFLEWVDNQREYSQASLRMKYDHIRKYFRYFTEFSNDNCRSFLKTMEAEGKHPKTINLYILSLKQYGEFAKVPVTLKKISIQRSLSVENVPTAKEYRTFVDWLKEHEKWEVYWMVRTLGMTGMRLSELVQVKWSDIMAGEFYPRCKGKKHRMVYFPKSLVSEATEWVRKRGLSVDRLLVCAKDGAPIRDRGVASRLRCAAKNAGFPLAKAHCHAFRHFFAKQYLAKTKDVIQLAELLGHESVDTTRLYLQKSKQEQKRDINRNIDW